MSQQERIIELELGLIVSDKELEVRAEIDQDTIQDYYDAMETEEDLKKFPPVTVYFDGCRYWLADGHHRYWAALRRGYTKMTVRVIDGTHDEAILAAVKLNINHGLRFKNDDWEKIIELVAGKEQWKKLTNRELARELGCHEKTIRNHRPDDSVADQSATEKRIGKDGKMYKARKTKAPGRAPTLTPDARKTPQAENVPTEPDRTTDADTGDVTETVPANSRPIRGESSRFIEAREEQAAILADIETVVHRINKWFDTSPESLHKEFEEILRKRFGEICD